jgi:hypothetical protein
MMSDEKLALRALLVTASHPQPIRKGDEVFSAPSKEYLAHLAADTCGQTVVLTSCTIIAYS